VWTCTPQPLYGGRGLRYVPYRGNASITWADALDGWERDANWRFAFLRWLIDAPYAGFKWETPPVTADTVGQPFEFVLLNAAGFGTRPDARPFDEAFRSAGGREAVAFKNLSGDATLVAPCPTGPTPAYVHLASFVRGAADSQRHALWQMVASAVRDRLNDRPVWVSTAGMGVAWLHVRLDDRPKYYGHAPYGTFPRS
jgi:hypothetical protein